MRRLYAFVMILIPAALLQGGVAGFQEFIVPGPEQLLRGHYISIDNDPAIGNDMHSVISVTASTDNTVINYDHWENGYGTADETVTLDAGEFHIFESANIPSNPRDAGQTFYDGGDRISVIGGQAFVTRASWPESPGTVLALAWEVYPIQALQQQFELPAGIDLFQSDDEMPFADFEAVILMVQSAADGNSVTVTDPDGAVIWSGTLNKGESITDTGLRGLELGTTVDATDKVQIQFVIGDQNLPGARSEVRGFSGVPTTAWGTQYGVPITSFERLDTRGNFRSDVYLYNPHESAITITYHDSTSGTFVIAPDTLVSYAQETGHYVPKSMGVCFEGTDTFWGFSAVGTGYDTWDWGFDLMPSFFCRSEYFVGWAPGDLNLTNNYSAVYVIAKNPNTTVYVDYDQDRTADLNFSLDFAEVERVVDPSDNDMSGAHIWATDTIAISYGEISGSGTATGSPALDLGYTVLPLPEEWIDRALKIEKGVNIDTIVAYRPAQFDIVMRAFDYPIGSTKVTDHLPPGWQYSDSTTVISFSDGTPDITLEPTISGDLTGGYDLFWNLGYVLNPNDSIIIEFSAEPTDQALEGLNQNSVEGSGENGGNDFTPDEDEFIVIVQPAAIGDEVWDDLDGDGVRSGGETGLAGVILYLIDAAGDTFEVDTTEADGSYLFENIIPGSYTVDLDETTLPAGYSSTTFNDPLSVTVAEAENYLDADFGYRAPGTIGDRIWDDGDADGVQDAAENGLAGVVLYLIDALGDTAGRDTTDVLGAYLFENVAAGDYQVHVDAGTIPAGYAITTLNEPLSLTLAAAEQNFNADFGYTGNIGIHLEKWTNSEDADVPRGPAVPVGGAVTWSYTVSNSGAVALENVSLSDSDPAVSPAYQSGDANGNGLLDPDEIWIYTASDTASAGSYNNLGSVSAAYLNVNVSDQDPSHYFGGDPEINIEKSTNGQDADSAPGPTIDPGDPVSWSYTLTNSGNIAIGTIMVSDLDPDVTPVYQSGDTDSDSLLDVDETWIYTASATAETGQYQNIAQVNGVDEAGTPVSDQDLSHYFGPSPAVHLEKSTNSQDADYPNGPAITAGDSVTWTYTVSNTGNVALENVSVTDDQIGAISVLVSGDLNSDNLLDIDEIWTFVHKDTAGTGQYANLGSVSAFYAGQPVTDSDSSHYFGGNPGINLEKRTEGVDADTPPGPTLRVPGTVTWSYSVSNIGNVALTGVSLLDSDPAVTPVLQSGDINANDSLDVGEIWLYSASAGVQPGPYSNSATVSAQDILDNPVSDTDPSNYFGAQPGIHIEKLTNGDDADEAIGPRIWIYQPVSWTYIVSNTGNVALDSVSVTDSDTGLDIQFNTGDLDNDAELDTNETWTYDAAGATQAGQYSNTGTAEAWFMDESVSDDDPSHYFGLNPALHLEKSTNGLDADTEPGPILQIDDPVDWVYLLTNVGNLPLGGITVSDSDPGVDPVYQSGDVNGNDSLDIDETWTFSAAGMAANGQYSNIGTAAGTGPDGHTAVDSDYSHYFGQGELDFGDAPEPYPTTLADGGAVHAIVPGYALGDSVDSENDGQPDPSGSGDGVDDGDGVVFQDALVQGDSATIVVTATAAGLLNAWIDFNADGDWDDAGEQIFVNTVLAGGANTLTFAVPGDAEIGATYSRFRFSSAADLGYGGYAPDGEVEDYLTDILVPVELTAFTAASRDESVRLEWVTQSETENLGFHIYRKTADEEEYRRVTPEIVPGAGNSSVQQRYSFIDEQVIAGTTYSYKLEDISFRGQTKIHGPVEVTVAAPARYALDQNFPNPFNPDTRIRFRLKESGFVSLSVYNLNGQRVRQLVARDLPAGSHQVRWDGCDESGALSSSGTYLVTLRVNDYVETRKMALMK